MICAKCQKDLKSVDTVLPGIEGHVCSNCRRLWQEEQNPELKKIRSIKNAEFYKQNAERLKAKSRKYRQDYGEKVRLQQREAAKRQKPRIRESGLLRRHGITQKIYEQMLINQNSICAICYRTDSGSKQTKYFCVDHDHKTGKIRELLCVPCNAALGHIKDSPEVAIRLAEYLRKHHE